MMDLVWLGVLVQTDCLLRIAGVSSFVAIALAVGHYLPVSAMHIDTEGLRAAIAGLRRAAETVRSAGAGLRPAGTSLGEITEQLWLFSARVESLLRQVLVSNHHQSRLITDSRPAGIDLARASVEMLVPVDIPHVDSYSPAPGHPLAARLLELALAVEILAATSTVLRGAAIGGEQGNAALLPVAVLDGLALKLRRDIATLGAADPGAAGCRKGDWDKL